jgi:hypothetical protein
LISPREAFMRKKLLGIGLLTVLPILSLQAHAIADAGADAGAEAGTDAATDTGSPPPKDSGAPVDTGTPEDSGEPSDATPPSDGPEIIDSGSFGDVIIADGGDVFDVALPPINNAPPDSSGDAADGDNGGGGCSVSRRQESGTTFELLGLGLVVGLALSRRRR